jgi:2-polyprenyl-6-methoxyphenol hydroxylase-like FAD-dependent oxidoreductase
MITETTYDVLVVGARCAGAATAMLLARKGLRVLLIDRGSYGTDTTSTHALMRGGVLQLHRWGILPRLKSAGTPAVRETTFHYGDETVTVPIKPCGGIDALYAPRRTLLDSMLVDAASAAGVDVRYGHNVVELSRRWRGRVCGAAVVDSNCNMLQVKADMVVGADGLASNVARLAAAEILHEARHTTAIIYGYFPDLELRGYHWWYRPGIGVGAIPTNGRRHCVFVAMPPERLRNGPWRRYHAAAFSAVLREADPVLAASLAAFEPESGLSVFAGRKGFLRRASGPGWALVGDAGYFKDPLTAHGITDAFRDAELLANAIAGGNIADYAAIRDELSLPLFQVTDAIAALDWDLARIKALHGALSEAMKWEVEHLLTLGDAQRIMIEEEVS